MYVCVFVCVLKGAFRENDSAGVAVQWERHRQASAKGRLGNSDVKGATRVPKLLAQVQGDGNGKSLHGVHTQQEPHGLQICVRVHVRSAGAEAKKKNASS